MYILKRISWFFLINTLVLTLSQAINIQPTLALRSVVHAVLFYSPSCSHCHQVITVDLPPLIEQYGKQLDVLAIDVTNDRGQSLYQAAILELQIIDERLGVPTLVVGSTVLVGSLEIPEQFPAIIENGLASGGIDWPEIPGLGDLIEEQSPAAINSPNLLEKFSRDPVANSLAVVLLVAMLASLVGVARVFLRRQVSSGPNFSWFIPIPALLGLGVAAYLSYIEFTQTQAVCGPVGDCNAVQQSPYARLFGVFPVGVLGLLGYLAILAAWAVYYYGYAKIKHLAAISLFGLTATGVLFSIYLTFLEPFVIGATCAWCLSSALLITFLFWVSTPLAVESLSS